jgi:hypothetical protein
MIVPRDLVLLLLGATAIACSGKTTDSTTMVPAPGTDVPTPGTDVRATETETDAPVVSHVHFVLTNRTSADRFVITSPMACDAYAIVPMGASSPLLLDTTVSTCDCACAEFHADNIVDTWPLSGLARLAPGASQSFDWDARSLSVTTVPLTCDGRPLKAATVTHKAAGAGSYSVTFQVPKAVPSQCDPAYVGDPSIAACGYALSNQATACDLGGETVTVAFTLPSSGDLTVPVDLE